MLILNNNAPAKKQFFDSFNFKIELSAALCNSSGHTHAFCSAFIGPFTTTRMLLCSALPFLFMLPCCSEREQRTAQQTNCFTKKVKLMLK